MARGPLVVFLLVVLLLAKHHLNVVTSCTLVLVCMRSFGEEITSVFI